MWQKLFEVKLKHREDDAADYLSVRARGKHPFENGSNLRFGIAISTFVRMSFFLSVSASIALIALATAFDFPAGSPQYP